MFMYSNEPISIIAKSEPVSCAQWVVSLGSLDVTTAVMTLSNFHSAPRIGHLMGLSISNKYMAQDANDPADLSMASTSPHVVLDVSKSFELFWNIFLALILMCSDC